MLRILHTNDMHGTLSAERAAGLRGIRDDFDLYFDSGDAIKAGNLGIPLRPEAVWAHLAELRCTASVPGNRETHPLEAGFRAKLAGVGHPLLCANVRAKSGEPFLLPSHVLEVRGVRVGVFGVMVAMVTERMRTQVASAYLWSSPIEAAMEQVKILRPQVDLLVALTHVGFRVDQELAARCPEIDVIFGGHSHTVLEQPVRVERVAIAQGGSHSRFIGDYIWDPASGLSGNLKPFPVGKT